MIPPPPGSRGPRAARFAGILLVAFLVQTVLIPASWKTAAEPDFLLAAVAGIAFVGGPGPGIGFGAAAGLLQDSFSGGVLGMHGFSKPLAAFVAARLAGSAHTDSRSVPPVVMTVAAAVDLLALWGLDQITGGDGFAGGWGAVALGFPLTVAAGWLGVRALSGSR